MDHESAQIMRRAANDMNEAAGRMAGAVPTEYMSRFMDNMSSLVLDLRRNTEVQVKLAAMLALNEKRARLGQSQAYDEAAILDLLKEL